jgi:hypothetical protein
MFEKIADAVKRLARPAIPLAVDLWDIATVAQFLKREAKVVRERIAVLLDFPKAIRLPETKGQLPCVRSLFYLFALTAS